MLFSIITPTKNSEKTIKNTIRSLNNQVYKKFEHIVLDSNSKDKTIEICRKYARYKIRIYRKKDKGLYYAMNEGILKSKGEIIAFLNSDDWFNKNTLKNVNTTFVQNNSDIIYGNSKFYKKKRFYFYNLCDIDKIDYTNSLSHPSIFYKRYVLKKNLYNTKFKISSDYDLTLRLIKKRYKFFYLNKFLSNISLGGISSNILLSSKEFFKIQKKYFGTIKSSFNFLRIYNFKIFIIFSKYLNNKSDEI